jgi:RNA polymerase sigma factor (sigma-70 family)
MQFEPVTSLVSARLLGVPNASREAYVNQTSTVSTDSPTNLAEYCTILHDSVVSIIRRTWSGHDAFDIAQNLVERVLRSPGAVMAVFPDPLVYASVCARNAGLDFDRTERGQRCEGARLTTNAAGERGRARTWLSGDRAMSDGDVRLFDTVADGSVDFVDALVESDEAKERLDVCLRGLSQTERDLLHRVDGHGMYITEVAATVGIRRETLNRRLTRIRAHAKTNAAAVPAAA